MNIYHCSQTVNQGYDTYSDMVVCAKNEDAARLIHPRSVDEKIEMKEGHWLEEGEWFDKEYNGHTINDSSWALPKDIVVKFLGSAAESIQPGVLCASYHAG